MSATVIPINRARTAEIDPEVGMRVKIRMPEIPQRDDPFFFVTFLIRQLCMDVYTGTEGTIDAVELDECGRKRYTVNFGTVERKVLKGDYRHERLQFLGDGE